jgi:hypothetical protein
MPLPDETPHSPAMAFLAHAWAHRSRAIQASGRRTKDAMCQTLTLAIQLGLPFALHDFTWLMTNQRASYEDTSPFASYLISRNSKTCGEEFYTFAIHHSHTTACQSFERWKGRRPFFAQGTRLHLGAELPWEGLRTFVTSFDDERATLTACSYGQGGRHSRGGSEYAFGNGPIQHRWTLTHADLAAASRRLHATSRTGGVTVA